jgi:hypothetical protein
MLVSETLLGGIVVNQIETNIFAITNLAELSSRYRLYRIRGLSPDQEEYEQNVQILIRRLSFRLQSPVTVIQLGNQPHLVLHEESPEPPSPYPLVRATAYFEPTDKLLPLDFEHPTLETERICLRFLQFSIEGALFLNRRFWQPSSGDPFFEYAAVMERDGVSVFRGYGLRVVPVDDHGFGVCVDVKHAYISSRPLPVRIPREEFRKFKGTRCIYHYGSRWYEVKLHDHTGLTVSEQLIPNGDGRNISLIHFIREHALRPLPREVVELDSEGSALRYLNNRDEPLSVAAALCYPLFDTSDRRVGKVHRQTILPPHVRRSLIHDFVQGQLREVQFKNMMIRVSPAPFTTAKRVFLPPDLALGSDTVLSVRGTKGATYVSLEQLGQVRLSGLQDPEIGPHVRKPLDNQYFVLPKSVVDTYGDAFVKDLVAAVGEVYPFPYQPTPIVYDDDGPKTFAKQGRAILTEMGKVPREPGYGVVMIHETVNRRKRENDKLAAMVMRELRKRGLYVSVIHTTLSQEVYQLVPNTPEGPGYKPDERHVGRLRGYLRNVALNKILLTNECWPIVLATPLHADLTITIDVQLHTACFTVMGKCGPDIRTIPKDSKQDEQLSTEQVRKVLLDLLREEATLGRAIVRTIVIQRDGRLFASEIKGIREAIEILKKEGTLPDDVSLNFVEIHKRSVASVRIFEIESRPGGREFVNNPQVGTHYIARGSEAYLCSTGREFRRPGTSNPLHVRYIQGAMPFEELLEDIYAQTCLAWTRPEDCSRVPMTLKLTDIRLREHAGGYDEDALEYGDESIGEDDHE